MKTLKLKKFSSQSTLKILGISHSVVLDEGCKFYSTLDAVLCDYLNKKGIAINKRIVVTQFVQGLQEFDELYKELSK